MVNFSFFNNFHSILAEFLAPVFALPMTYTAIKSKIRAKRGRGWGEVILPAPSAIAAPGASTFSVTIDKNVENPLSYSRPSFFRWTCKTEMAAGVIPEMRDACPSERGLMRLSFSTTSLESPGRPV